MPAWRILVASLGALAASACHRHSPATATSAPPPSTPPAAVAPPPASGLAALVVSSRTGTDALGPDGQPLRHLSRTPAAAPRWLPGHQSLLFLGTSRAGIRDVRRVSLAGGDETIVAYLGPMRVCKGTAREPSLAPQSPDDFLVDAKRNVACLQLLDRNANMADVNVSLQIDLTSGAVARRAVMTSGCELVDGLASGDAFHCDDPVPPPIDDWSNLSRPDEWDLRAASPSRRWALLQGNENDGDAVHFDALLYDTQSHAIFPLVAGAWPPPLDAARRAHLDQLHGHTRDIVGESDVRWLGDDLLVVDQLLVQPGQRVVRVAGDVIR